MNQQTNNLSFCEKLNDGLGDVTFPGIRLLFTWLPAIFAVITALTFIFYPLRHSDLAKIENNLIEAKTNPASLHQLAVSAYGTD